jgi:aspartate-semialdehyde dehydrogenase
LRAGSTVLDLSGALDQEPGVLVRAPWLGLLRVRLGDGRPVYAGGGAGAPGGAGAGAAAGAAATGRAGAFAAATVLEPASAFGRAAMDELHQQTVSLLSFQGLPRAIYDAQVAYNLLSGLGESATINLGAEEARIRRHYEALGGGRWPALALQVIHAPVFHGMRFRLPWNWSGRWRFPRSKRRWSGEHVDLVLEDTDSPSNLAATGQNDVLVRLRPERTGAIRTWLRGCGCGRLRTICGCMRRMRWSARWICGGCGRRGRCSKRSHACSM